MTANSLPKGLGPAMIGNSVMPWSAGCIANGFVFFSGIVGHVDDRGEAVADLKLQVHWAFRRLLA
jgi:enamine deaminase RidA (YjgF/YER057c/UK114 family)